MPLPIPRNMRIHEPTPPAGPQYAGGFSFVRTVQPVLDRYCIECHGLNRTDAGVNLLGIRENGYNRAHNTLAGNSKYTTIAYRNQETGYSTPKEYFAHGGRLANYLLTEHRKYADLDRESFPRIVDWLDLNTQYYGDYSRNRVEERNISGEAEKALREAVTERFGSELARQPIEAQVNVGQPSESRILNGPLAKNAGGWGQIANGSFRNTSDPAYIEMRQLVEACIIPQEAHDVAGTCGREHCNCGTCWTRKIREAIKFPTPELEVEPFPRNVQLEPNVQDYVSNDRDNLGKPAAQGRFTDQHAEQTVTFKAKEGRYIMLRALTEADGSPYTAVREITVLSIKPVDEVAVAQ